MPPILFTKDMEVHLMRIYEEVWVRASGSTLRSAEKYALVAEKVNAVGKPEGWREVTAENVATKMDTLRRKGRKHYLTFRKATRTGAPVADDFDLEAAYKAWGAFKMYHQLFFNHQTLGPGGFNEDTASLQVDDDDQEKPPATPTADDVPPPATADKAAGEPAAKRKAGEEDVVEDGATRTPGTKPSPCTTSRRSGSQTEVLMTMMSQMTEAEAMRSKEREEADARLAKERQEFEEKREMERREYEERREEERAGREERHEERRQKGSDERRREEREFNATLLVRLFSQQNQQPRNPSA